MATQKVSIRYLIDVAIGNPEPGIVNFNALYTVLQAISEKLSLQDDHIEIDSSFCPVTANVLDSKSNLSSERLVDHQVFDFPSEAGEDRVWGDHKKPTADPDSKKQSRITINDQEQQADDRKVVFNPSAAKEDDHVCIHKKLKDEKLENYRTELRQHIDALNARLGKMENVFETSADSGQGVECMRHALNELQVKFNFLQTTIGELKDARNAHEEDISACRKKLEHDKLAAVIDELKNEQAELRDMIYTGNFKKQGKMSIASALNNETEATADYTTEYAKLQGQILELKSNVCCLTEQLLSLEENLANNKRSSSVITLKTFQDEVSTLKESLEKATFGLNELFLEHEAQKSSINDLTSKLERLCKTKIDKEDINELLSEKADYTMLQRKVSVENMETDRRKLEKQLSEITDCFILNDERVQRQIGDIKKFLGDQSLEDMLFDFKLKVDKEIQVVRDAIKRLAEMKPEVDSAAGRLKDLHCIACDQDVVMKAIEMSNIAKFGDAYVSKSISPAITFEIGKLREAGKIGPMEIDENLCDMAKNYRHTGGLHTIITNKDRVLRTRKK